MRIDLNLLEGETHEIQLENYFDANILNDVSSPDPALKQETTAALEQWKIAAKALVDYTKSATSFGEGVGNWFADMRGHERAQTIDEILANDLNDILTSTISMSTPAGSPSIRKNEKWTKYIYRTLFIERVTEEVRKLAFPVQKFLSARDNILLLQEAHNKVKHAHDQYKTYLNLTLTEEYEGQYDSQIDG